MNRRKFLVALGAIPVAGVCLGKDALVVDGATKAVKSTHVTATEIAKMRVGDSMRNGKITSMYERNAMDHAPDAHRDVVGFNDTIRSKHQRATNVALRKIVDDAVFRMMTYGK